MSPKGPYLWTHFVACIVIFLMLAFDEQNLLILMKSNSSVLFCGSYILYKSLLQKRGVCKKYEISSNFKLNTRHPSWSTPHQDFMLETLCRDVSDKHQPLALTPTHSRPCVWPQTPNTSPSNADLFKLLKLQD